jgi:hypothetical protein
VPTVIEGDFEWDAIKARTNKVVLLRPEIYELFGSDEAINAALAAVAQFREAVMPRKRRARAA